MRKITEYLLRPDHPEGAAKARYFLARGFSLGNWEAFAQALKAQAVGREASMTEGSFGTKYVVEDHIECPDGSQPRIRTVWMIAHGSDYPLLVTAHPLR